MPNITPIELGASPAEDEGLYVHSVYNSIATHFSQTRYKPWPLISAFLASIAPGSVGLDSGTGNGKYLPLDLGGVHLHSGGKDRDVVLGDAMDFGWRNGAFDFAISIATIHHLSTAERRCRAIKALLRCLNPTHGRLLIYVWATEQDTLSKRVIPNVSEGSQGDESGSRVQDVLVPWVHSASSTTNSQAELTQSNTRPNPKVFQRYYHLFGPSELFVLLCQAAKELGLQLGAAAPIIQEGWERSNYYIEARLWES
ncbi:hypothetical protein BS47DRAFT_1376711 [Hydnum rufescens UP504]|uniref:Methyltransferase type 11 domain-containing protein n=1 Tax=Hydnum rufescens UP504 TaxID=1448309 RepID=A0A9P6AWY6_9AGAM|nr:hypothetical protein BS47DRAFT_1376711 [Hydnum rufescens UP504]